MPERLLLQDVGPKKPQAYKLDADITEWKFFWTFLSIKLVFKIFAVLNLASHVKVVDY